ncbi:MAG TPA: YciI family protein [Acetobacteraceae bacterium]|nr:YciI family protein [Acetobacteraceae bacterium]
MVIVKATEDTEKGTPPTQEAMEAMHKYGEAVAEAGIVLVDGAGLMNSSHGKRFAFDGASLTVTDGPFAESRELIAGYSIWEVKNMDEAVAWAKRWPFPPSGRSEIEIRPLFEWQPAEESFSEKIL